MSQKINWKVRMKNDRFVATAISSAVLILDVLTKRFGVDTDANSLESFLFLFMELVLSGMTILGVVNDPTTKGFQDSDRAMNYDEPLG